MGGGHPATGEVEIAGLEGGTDPDEGGVVAAASVAEPLGQARQLLGQGQAFGEGAGVPDGVVAMGEHVGQRGGVAETAGRRQGPGAQRHATLPLAAEGELTGERGLQAGRSLVVGVGDGVDGSLEQGHPLGVDLARPAEHGPAVGQGGGRQEPAVGGGTSQAAGVEERIPIGGVTAPALGLSQRHEDLGPPTVVVLGRLEHLEGPLEVTGGIFESEAVDGGPGGTHRVVDRLVVLGGRRRRLEEVVGQLGDVRLVAGVEDLQSAADTRMQLHAPGGGELPVEGLTDQGVREGVGAGRHLDDELGVDGLLQGPQELLFGEVADRFQHRVAELGADDSRDGQDLVGGGGEAGHSPANHLADPLGDAEPVEAGRRLPSPLGAAKGARFSQVADDLVEEEGVAVGLAPEREGQRPVLLAGILAGTGEQGGDVVGGEAAELEAGEAVVAAEVGEHLGEGVGAGKVALAVGADDEHGGGPPVPKQVAQHEQGRLVGPVQVVEDEQHRARLGGQVEQLGHTLEEPVALHLDVTSRRRRPDGPGLAADSRKERADVFRDTTDPGFDLARRLASEVVGQGFDEGLVGDERLFVAATVEHGAGGQGPAGQLAGQAGLADPGLARHQHELAVAIGDPLPGSFELAKLPLTADEGNVAGQRRGQAGGGRRQRLPEHLAGEGRVREALQGHRSDVLELEAAACADEGAHEVGGEDLAAPSLIAQALGHDDRGAEIVGLVEGRLADVQPCPHGKGLVGRAVVAGHGLLHGHRAAESAHRAREGDHEPVAEILDLLAAVGGHGRAQDAEVGSAQGFPLVVAHAGQQLRRPDEVGEEQRDHSPLAHSRHSCQSITNGVDAAMMSA